jgi:hypothetical protein
VRRANTCKKTLYFFYVCYSSTDLGLALGFRAIGVRVSFSSFYFAYLFISVAYLLFLLIFTLFF